MGIEPTDHMISMRSDSFEDYGLHQQNKHFPEFPYLRRIQPECQPTRLTPAFP